MSGESRLKAYQAVVESRLDQLLPLPSAIPTKLHEAMRYSALAPGKRIRPLLAMASAEAICGDAKIALDVGCASELIHCFSLIHDDLPSIDDDDLRRGRPTCHIVFGEAMALLAGDALFALAFDVASHAQLDDNQSRRVVQCLAKATGSQGLVGGEVMDILAERTNPTRENLQEIHRRKTGALISATCTAGGYAAGASEEEIERLKSFGDRIGIAFQVADDLLNEIGDESEIGKAVGSDRKKGKATYPSLFGVLGAKSEADRLLFDAMSHIESLTGDTSMLKDLAQICAQRIR